jgi:hypothetical protein
MGHKWRDILLILYHLAAKTPYGIFVEV